MSKLTVQMQATADGFVSSEASDWAVWDWSGKPSWDDELVGDFNATIVSMGSILLSRPMIESGYLDHWETAADENADDDRFKFARHVAASAKFVITSRDLNLQKPRTTVVLAPLQEAVRNVKQMSADDVIAFGGTSFAAALVRSGLVDELQLYINPTATGAGDRLFEQPTPLTLLGSKGYSCGIVVNRYRIDTVTDD